MMSIDDVVVFIEINFGENLCGSNQFPAGEIAASSSINAVSFFNHMHNEMFSVAVADNNILMNAVLAMMRSIR